MEKHKHLIKDKKCKCYLCGDEGHFTKECPSEKRNIRRAAIFEGLDIPDGYDIISIEEGETASDARYSVSENEDIDESLEHQIQALSLNMLHHYPTVKRLGEDKAGWRPSILLPPHQMSCEHDCCRCQSMKRARIHCPKCGVVSCNMCGPHYFDREVPVEPATYTAEGPAQARAFIKAQSEYIQWCDVKKDRLHRENC